MKSDNEVTFIRRAAAIVDAMHAKVIELVEPGLPKNMLVGEIQKQAMLGAGGHDSAAGIAMSILVMTLIVLAERLGALLEDPMSDDVFGLPLERFCATLTGDLLGPSHTLARIETESPRADGTVCRRQKVSTSWPTTTPDAGN